LKVADLVIHHDARRPLNGFLDRFRTRFADIVASDDGGFSMKDSTIYGFTRQSVLDTTTSLTWRTLEPDSSA
jgi:hypothetical protein